MTQIRNLDDILNKVEELRDSLRVSEEMFPIISEVFIFIREVVPLLLDANLSIKETTGHLPTATDNINSVSQTTELATNEVLDTIELITEELNDLRDRITNNTDTKNQLEILDRVQNQVSEIVFAFQFQDITTQKLEQVIRILNAINEKFSNLWHSFNKLRDSSALSAEVFRAIESELKNTLENENREFFDKRTKDVVRHTDITQDMIDNLFK